MKGFLLLILIYFYPFLLLSQNMERLEKQAAALFEKKEFALALEVFDAIEKAKPTDPKVLAQIGICHFETNHLAPAEDYLMRSLNAAGEAPAIAYQYLGKTFHAQLDFEKAIHCYKLFLKNSPDNSPHRSAVKDDIRRCANGKMVRRQTPLGSIVPLASPVNTEADEFSPMFSPNHPAAFYFSSDRRQNIDGNFSSDIYTTERVSGSWTPPISIGLTLNTAAHEIPLGFNMDGDVLYFFRGNTTFSGDILVDTFKENILEKNVLHATFISPIRAWEGDCDPHFHNDSTLFFASRRPGGFGGLDIYITSLTQNGWTPPANLGPIINSAYDDRSPFLAADGHTLYFSTNDARRSIGGSDILKSVFLDWANKWTPPENMGFPFNSAADDEGFSLSENGRSALFASSRKTGLGKRDVYFGIFPEKENAQTLQSRFPVFQNTENPGSSPGKENAPLEKNTTDLTIQPVPFSSPLLPLPEDALAQLRKVSILLKTYPLEKIVMVGYAIDAEEDPLPVSNVLEKAVAFLLTEGTRLSQVKWLAAPAKFSPQKNGLRAIEIFAVNPEILPPPIQIIQTAGTSFEAKFFKKSLGSLVYQVQVPLGESTHADELLRFFPDGILFKQAATDQTWFSLGYQLSWAAAVEAEKSARKIGFAQAVAVPVLNGWELSKESASKHLHEYPELAFFIERE